MPLLRMLRGKKFPALAAALLAAPFLLASCGARLGDAHALVGTSGTDGTGGISWGDDAVRPDVRELREAKAASMQEWDLLINGGMPLYRGDGSSSNINSVKFAASSGALTLDYRASPQLNASAADGEPQELNLVVYHLNNRAAFDRLARNEEGLRTLLEGDYFDDSVAGVRTHRIQPGESARLFEDRYDGGRFVALVAGYDNPRARTAAYVTEYRLYQWYTAGGSVFSRDRAMYSPYPLHLSVKLGEGEMLVEDTDRMLGRMRGVTSIQRGKVFNRLRPSFRSEAAVFIGGDNGAVVNPL